MAITKSQRIANEEHFDFHISMIKEGGYYGWINEGEIMYVKNKKFELTQIQYCKLANITTKKWLKKNTMFKKK
jgi:hypothetical protein